MNCADWRRAAHKETTKVTDIGLTPEELMREEAALHWEPLPEHPVRDHSRLGAVESVAAERKSSACQTYTVSNMRDPLSCWQLQ